MKRIAIYAALGLTIATTAQAQPDAPVIHGPPVAAAELVAADRAFEHRVQTAGVAAAYADVMSPTGSLALTGGSPVHGGRAISSAMGAMMGTGVLHWTCEDVFASTGDLGATEGRWTFTAKGAAKATTGHYVTVWRKTPSGAWQGAIDVGVPDS